MTFCPSTWQKEEHEMAGNPLWTGDNISNSRLAAGTVGVVRACQFISGPRCRLGDANGTGFADFDVLEHDVHDAAGVHLQREMAFGPAGVVL